MKVVDMSIAELICVVESLQHTKNAIIDINTPIFGAINGDTTSEYTTDEANEAVALADDLINTFTNVIAMANSCSTTVVIAVEG